MDSVILFIIGIIGFDLIKDNFEKFTNSNNEIILLGGNSKNQNTFKYSENKRLNFNFGKYPPCFSVSSEVQKIFDLLDMANIKDKFQQLFDIYSILLCQKYHAGYKTCSSEMLAERIKDLEEMLANNFNPEKYIDKVSKYVKLNNSKISRLIIISYYLIEKEMKKINDEEIISLNRKFYYSTFKELMLLCDGY
jgi:hypothetical protein